MAKFNLNDILNSQSKSEPKRKGFIIQEIPIDNIIPSDKNQYGIREIEELASSIELTGLSHNLVVRDNENGTYELISGERRFNALKMLGWTTAPCKVEKHHNDVLAELQLILSNSTSRELTDYEKTYQAGRLKELLLELKKSGHEIPGKLRDRVAEIMNVSPTQIAIMESINKNLTPEFKEEFKDGNIGISTAYELSTLSPEKQEETHQEYKLTGPNAVKDVKKKTEKPVVSEPKTTVENRAVDTAYAIMFSGGGYVGGGHAHGVPLYRADLYEAFEDAETDRSARAEIWSDMEKAKAVKIVLSFIQ